MPARRCHTDTLAALGMLLALTMRAVQDAALAMDVVLELVTRLWYMKRFNISSATSNRAMNMLPPCVTYTRQIHTKRAGTHTTTVRETTRTNRVNVLSVTTSRPRTM